MCEQTPFTGRQERPQSASKKCFTFVQPQSCEATFNLLNATCVSRLSRFALGEIMLATDVLRQLPLEYDKAGKSICAEIPDSATTVLLGESTHGTEGEWDSSTQTDSDVYKC
jgi:hypothetical protein